MSGQTKKHVDADGSPHSSQSRGTSRHKSERAGKAGTSDTRVDTKDGTVSDEKASTKSLISKKKVRTERLY